jgi:O-antigen/teichoic acid export membrane protein
LTGVFDKLKKILLLDLTSIGSAELLGTGITAIFWFYLASIISSEEYGKISYFISIAGITSIVCLFGFENTLKVYRAKQIMIQGISFFISIVSSTISAIVLFIIFYNLGMSSLIIGYVIVGLGASEYLGRRAFVTYSKYFVINKTLSAVFPLVGYYTLGLDGVLIGIALASFPYLITIYHGFKNSKIDFQLLRPYRGFIVNNSILQIVGSSYKAGDKLLIGLILGFISLGNYYLAIQFYAVFMLIPQIIFKYLLPHDATGKPKIRLKRMTIIFAIITAFLGFFLSPFAVPQLFPKYTEAIQIIQILSLNVIPGTVCLICYSKFLGNENSKTVMIAYGIQAGTQLPCIFIFGTIFGVLGISFAYVLGTTLQALFLIRKANYKLSDIFR